MALYPGSAIGASPNDGIPQRPASLGAFGRFSGSSAIARLRPWRGRLGKQLPPLLPCGKIGRMSDVQTRPAARLERDLASRWVWALCISLGLHMLAFGIYETGRQHGWWQRFNFASILPGNKMLTELLAKKEPVQPPPQQEDPLIFINVDPSSATPEPPKNATHYSSKNAVAANEVPANESTIPNIAGRQELVPRVQDAPRANIVPLQ